MSGIDKIGVSLRELLKEREIIARCELLNRTYDIVRTANLTDTEREELQKTAGLHIAAGIFASMMSDTPIFNDLPKLDTYTQINGRIFHFLHTQRYSKQDFDNAYRKFLTSLPEIKSMLRQNLTDLLKELMRDAGYSLVDEGPGGLKFEARERKVNALVFAGIGSLDMRKFRKEAGDEADSVILVPSTESLEPFVQFFREKGALIEEAGIQVWVANMEKGTIDPFIGYTTDLDIYEQFKNPRLAEMVRSNWGAKQ
ncbi:MAG TPA: hypothetical protein VLB04_07950 [Methanotrichaceae archaeon]|nr:hypothetical protein [Methanotrichaceae archaeon]